MCDEWMPVVRLNLTAQQFQQLPRNPAYRYERFGDQVVLTPRPRHYHALLKLERREGDSTMATLRRTAKLRELRDDDWEALTPLFAGVFATIQPFGGLDDATRRQAARASLERTRTGGDGPLAREACFVAEGVGGDRIGAILITLLPPDDPTDEASYYWSAPPPADCLATRQARPHLTWIFVSPWEAGKGVGTSLLAAAGNRLLDLGFPELLSTFLLGNDSSILWHWRNGFTLLPHPGSTRLMARRWSRCSPANSAPSDLTPNE